MQRKALKLIGPAVALAALASTLGGCKFFDFGNPFLPNARLYAQATPNMEQVDYVYKASDNTITATEKTPVQIEVSSFPNDGTPGVMFSQYSAEYFDMDNKSIPSMFIAKANFGVTQYIPPATAGKPSKITLALPIYNQQVMLFGQRLAYTTAGGIGLNPNFSHTIACRVSLYGQDDNFNQITVTADVPIKFTAQVSQ
jgi:hypothetical protein